MQRKVKKGNIKEITNKQTNKVTNKQTNKQINTNTSMMQVIKLRWNRARRCSVRLFKYFVLKLLAMIVLSFSGIFSSFYDFINDKNI